MLVEGGTVVIAGGQNLGVDLHHLAVHAFGRAVVQLDFGMACLAALGEALVAAGKAGDDDLGRPAKSRSDVA